MTTLLTCWVFSIRKRGRRESRNKLCLYVTNPCSCLNPRNSSSPPRGCGPSRPSLCHLLPPERAITSTSGAGGVTRLWALPQLSRVRYERTSRRLHSQAHHACRDRRAYLRALSVLARLACVARHW